MEAFPVSIVLLAFSPSFWLTFIFFSFFHYFCDTLGTCRFCTPHLMSRTFLLSSRAIWLPNLSEREQKNNTLANIRQSISERIVSKAISKWTLKFIAGGQLKTKNGQKYIINHRIDGIFISKTHAILLALLTLIVMAAVFLLTYFLLAQHNRLVNIHQIFNVQSNG